MYYTLKVCVDAYSAHMHWECYLSKRGRGHSHQARRRREGTTVCVCVCVCSEGEETVKLTSPGLSIECTFWLAVVHIVVGDMEGECAGVRGVKGEERRR